MKNPKSNKAEERQDTVTPQQAETLREALHRRVKRTQERRIQKRKRIHAH